MTAGKVEIPNLEELEDALLRVKSTDRFMYNVLMNLRSRVSAEINEQQKHAEWKDLVAYWQDGTVCEVKFEGFRINKAGTVRKKEPEVWNTYLGGSQGDSTEPYFWQELRFKDHAWNFKIWLDRKDPEGWPLVEVA